MFRYMYPMVLLAGCVSAADTAPQAETIAPSSITTKTLQPTQTAAPARDGNIAIFEEFEAASQKDTVEAYGLFIARHPNHTLTKQAKINQARAQARDQKQKKIEP